MDKKWQKKHKKTRKNAKKRAIFDPFFDHFFFEKKVNFFFSGSIQAWLLEIAKNSDFFVIKNWSDQGVILKITFWKILILSTENDHFWKKEWKNAKNALFGPPWGSKSGVIFYHHETEEFVGRGFGTGFWHF